MELPPDRSHVSTERRSERSLDLDRLDVAGCVELMIDDHCDVERALRAAAPDLTAFITELAERLRRGGRLIYVGAGTSGRLGVLDAAECPPTFNSDPDRVIGVIAGGDAALRRSSEAREDELDGPRDELRRLALTADDTVLGIAAGGTTPYVLGAIRIGLEAGAAAALLTCAASAEAPPGCRLLLLPTGSELLTGSTRLKAGSATKLALNIISTTVFVQLGKVYSNLMVDLRATNRKLTDRAIRILRQLHPRLSRVEAAQLLRQADGKLKVAIVMAGDACSAREAAARLDACGGDVRAALATPGASGRTGRA